ncbi:hypothetical protein JQC67_16790 [Aurantibacter crassamenti]|uniref:hypothetical protein n=1 Tax=Aurantibacter crassamenti TaxID=1837375 RepID=UPI00193AC5E9|nr:hypothetical protein [Aurantibacter crassamenti]MBM1107814.1 hypothetical protein [Aurantibacter crassamenti]
MRELTIYRLWVVVLLQCATLFGQPASKNFDSKAKGPNLAKTLNLRAELRDKDLLSLIKGPGNEFAPIDILNGELYYDKNEYSNIFYYLPGSFGLLYNKKKGTYKIELTYPEDDTGNRKVSFKAQFGSSIDENTEFLLERLLYQIAKKPTVKAVPFKMESTPKIEFPFSEFNIPTESILIIANTDYTKPMTVSWAVNQDEVQAFQASMAQDMNFNGKIWWENGEDKRLELDIDLSLQTPKTLGQFYFKKPSDLLLRGFKNSTSFPLKLNSIKVLNKEKSGNLLFDEIKLINTVVEPRSTYKDLPSEIKSKIRNFPPSDLLVEYEVLDCEECKTDAIYSMQNNKASSLSDWVQVWEIGAYEFTGASGIEVFVDKIYKRLEIKEGEKLNEAFKAPKLVNGQFSFKYRISIVLPDKVLKSRLIKNDPHTPSIMINKEFIKKHFREFRKAN